MTEITSLCTTAWCHEHDPVGDNGEPTHTSDSVIVTLTDGEDGHLDADQLDLLRAELFWDEAFTNPGIWAASGLADEILLDRAQGEKLADNLEAFARNLRELCKHLPGKEAA